MQPLVETAQASNLVQNSGVIEHFIALLIALGGLILALIQVILPWTPLLCWIAFWLLAVNWRQFYPVLMKGGLAGVLLTALMVILVWASISEPVGGYHRILGLGVNNLLGKTIYVTGLWLIAALCGSVQLTGGCGSPCQFDETPEAEIEEAHGHH